MLTLLCGLLVLMVIAGLRDRQAPAAVQPTPDPQAVQGQAVERQAIPNPLAGINFYVDPNSNAARQAAIWRTSRPADAAKMETLAALPTARWAANADAVQYITEEITAAAAEKTVPVLVAYYLPKRDCGLYSAGGAKDEAAYRQYIDALTGAVGTREAIVVLEPDALAQQDSRRGDGRPCLSVAERDSHNRLLRYAVERFQSLPRTYVYIDAGNSRWVDDVADMAGRLEAAGVQMADGFSLNVSNFYPIEETLAYGLQLSAATGGKHFVIDTSRNGNGPYKNDKFAGLDWCNPPGRALGHYPTTDTKTEYLDAYLYIKYPGESDGADPDERKCHDGPAAGVWWPEYALGLVERWPAALRPPAVR